MNYRHAFHAGNFADVMKHILLVRILTHLRRKETPFRVVDTHAGIGLYDLAADEATRTGEWQGGVARLAEPFGPEVEDLLAPYRRILAEVAARRGPDIYPGSPAIIREMLRPGDRAILVEKHPEDAAVLSDRFNAVHNLKVMGADGWGVLPGLIPPRERRGLVLIDPPYEEPDELAQAVARLAQAVRKWPTGTFALWYPIKAVRDTNAFAAALARSLRYLETGAPPPILRLELMVDDPTYPARLNGCGLMVVNPPWTLAAEAERILPALAERLARDRYGGYLCAPAE